MDLAKLQNSLSTEQGALPPVDKWHPAFCGDIDMQIKQDGSWWYMGTPIGRQALVKLFSGVLKKEHENYFLVTPVEKVGIQVEDVPFIVTEWKKESEYLLFTTRQGDEFVMGDAHPAELRTYGSAQTILPYVNVRRNLWARLHQNVFYQLAEIGREKRLGGKNHLILTSGTYEFSLGVLD